MRKILVTNALPYANGSIHLGHLVEYLQTDIWVRNQKMSENQCIYICADDAHGTPIMLKAHELGIKPEELIEKNYKNLLNNPSLLLYFFPWNLIFELWILVFFLIPIQNLLFLFLKSSLHQMVDIFLAINKMNMYILVA